MNPPTIDPILLGSSSVRAPTSHAVSVPITSRSVSVPVISRSACQCVQRSSPALPSTSEWCLSESDVLAALQLCVKTLKAFDDKRNEIVKHLLKEVVELKHRFRDAESDTDADDEGPLKKKKKKRTSSVNERPLTEGKVTNLSQTEKVVRKELMDMVNKEMKMLSGTPLDSHILTKNLAPGEYRLEDGCHLLIPDFGKDVMDLNNERLIEQAAHLVFSEQSVLLKDKNVRFTDKDVLWLAKASFCNWKTAYKHIVDDAAKEKAALQAKKGACSQRKCQKVNLVKFGADPTPLLLMDWMSEYFSSLDEGDENEKNIHRIKVRAATGLTLQGQEHNEIVWERVWPAFRSDKASLVNTVYQSLDDLHKAGRRDARKKSASNKHVDIGRINNRIPNIPPYPFMVDEGWYRAFVEGKTLEEPFLTKGEDPAGFGSKE